MSDAPPGTPPVNGMRHDWVNAGFTGVLSIQRLSGVIFLVQWRIVSVIQRSISSTAAVART